MQISGASSLYIYIYLFIHDIKILKTFIFIFILFWLHGLFLFFHLKVVVHQSNYFSSTKFFFIFFGVLPHLKDLFRPHFSRFIQLEFFFQYLRVDDKTCKPDAGYIIQWKWSFVFLKNNFHGSSVVCLCCFFSE